MKLWAHKLKRDTTTHLLEELKFKTLGTPNADKDELQQELSLTAGGDAKLYIATLENSLAVSCKNKVSPYDPTTPLLGIHPNELK